MYYIILAAIMTAMGTPSRAVDTLVIVEGRPGCTVQALHGDVTRPIVVCNEVRHEVRP